MSYLKFSPDLFLETQELNRLKKFLDDDGFRKALLANSLKFGLISKQFFISTSSSPQEEFLNGQVTEGAALTLQHQAISAINSSGNFVYRIATSNIATTGDNLWYWVKIKHQYSSTEVGKVAIDAAGNLTGNADTKFTEVLRGQPNFPAKIKFVNSAGNLLEYDVLEVIDDQNAILDNSTFAAETDLYYKVIGTFTPSSVPANADKEIFQYDSCELTLVAETSLNTRPTFIEGTEFFLARIKNSGSSLVIQDKRTQIWQTKADFFLKDIRTSLIPWIGVEKVKYSDKKSTLDKNEVYLSWTFRSSNYSVNSNLGILTINGGQGGKFKTVNDFTDGDFNGCRVYTSDGTYAIIKNSFLSGGQINCYLDVLDIDRYSSNGGSTFTGNEIVITPNAEEIEIICAAQEDASESQIHIGETQLSDRRLLFPINQALSKFDLLVYDSLANYEITYRFKNGNVYSEVFSMPSDTAFGYYTEKAYDSDGDILPIVQSNNYAQNLAGGYIKVYTSNIIELVINPSAYSATISRLDLGDKFGVDQVALSNAVPLVDLFVGTNRQYEKFTGSALTLSADMVISLNKKLIDANGLPCNNGNHFFLHFKQQIDLNGFTFKIVQEYVNPTTFTLIKELTAEDVNFIKNSEEGLFIRISYNGTDWFVNSVNEHGIATWYTVGGGGTGEPAFQNSWNYNAYPARFKYDANFVVLGGRIDSGTNGTVVFTLPVGFRPSTLMKFPAGTNTVDVAQIQVDTTGEVYCFFSGGSVRYLDGIRIPLD